MRPNEVVKKLSPSEAVPKFPKKITKPAHDRSTPVFYFSTSEAVSS
jgi:hypothetical protein